MDVLICKSMSMIGAFDGVSTTVLVAVFLLCLLMCFLMFLFVSL